MLHLMQPNNLPKPKSVQFTRKCTNPSGDIVATIWIFLGSWWEAFGLLVSDIPRWHHPRSGGIIDSQGCLKKFYHVACNGNSIGLIPQMQPLLSARPPVPVCSCTLATLVRFLSPLHSLITGNTFLSMPGHAKILRNYLGFRTKFEQKKSMRPFAGICARFAGTPGPRELLKPEK